MLCVNAETSQLKTNGEIDMIQIQIVCRECGKSIRYDNVSEALFDGWKLILKIPMGMIEDDMVREYMGRCCPETEKQNA